MFVVLLFVLITPSLSLLGDTGGPETPGGPPQTHVDPKDYVPCSRCNASQVCGPIEMPCAGCVPTVKCFDAGCGVNEVPSKKPGCQPACEETCQGVALECVLQPCVYRRCGCAPGYVRGPDRTCIIKSQCHDDSGSDSPGDFLNGTDVISDKCGDVTCQDGQVCEQQVGCDGKVTYDCVCGDNQEPFESTCNSACEPTCNDFNMTTSCITVCSDRKCNCKEGFVRDENHQCVAITQCSSAKECSFNEEFLECGRCEELTCGDKLTDGKESCQSCGKPGCYCKEGFLRYDGQCVKPQDCPGGVQQIVQQRIQIRR